MQQYADVVTDLKGNVVPGALVSILKLDGSLAPLYADDEVTPIANPITTDARGMFTFKAANGNYRRSILASGIVTNYPGEIILTNAAALAGGSSTPTASAIANVASGNLSGATVQAAINELDAEKVGLLQLVGDAGASLVGFLSDLVGAVRRPVKARLSDTVSVKDFGAVGTNDTSNVTLDTAAFMAALATGKNVFIPQGTYFVSTTMNLGYAQSMRGAGRGKTTINYTGSGDGIFCGSTAPISLIYDIELADFALNCSNKVSPVAHGIRLENCVYFKLERLSVFGAFSPNVPETLVGNGVYVTNNSIIGRITNVSCRQWNKGMYLKTLASSSSYWAASIVIDGQGEMASNMFGIVVGDPAIGYSCGVGLSIRDMCLQGNYSGGILVNSGESTLIDGCYFEGNANYDVTIGCTGAPSPACVWVTHNQMTSEDIGTTGYGTFPYLAKVIVVNGSFATIRDNDMSISTAIPLVRIAAAASSTMVSGNRLNSTAAANARMVNLSTTSIIDSNFPNQVPLSAAGTITRTLSSADGNVVVTGLGFRPRAITFNCAVDNAAENSVGYTDASGASRCVTSDSANVKTSSNYAIKIIRPTSADVARAALVSMDADGFTLNFTHTGSPPANDLIVNYLAIK